MGINQILFIAALICFLLGTFGVPGPVNFVALGLALVTLTQVLK